MSLNDFKPFAIAAGANVLSQADYNALAAVSTGWQSGVAKSPEVNKAVRQATFIAAAVAQYVADLSGQDVLDDGNVANFIAKLKAANGTQYLGKANNLSEISGSGPAAQISARTNLGLKGAAILDVGATSGTVAAGDDPRIVGALQRANNLSEIQNAQTARNNLGLKALATKDSLTAGDVGALPYNATAVAASKLAAARNIAGKAFDGTQDISIGAADVGAFSSNGGTLNGDMTLGQLLATNGLISTNGYAIIRAIFENGNQFARLLFTDSAGGQTLAYAEADFGKNLAFYVNGRKFTLDNSGNFIAPVAVYENGVRVYSPNNKPSASDIGALPSSGGTLGGPLTVNGQVSSAAGFNLYAGANVIAGGGAVYEGGTRVYSPNNPPPATTSAGLNSSGWWKDNSTGLIMQWGSFSSGSSNVETHNYPIAFPNAGTSLTANIGVSGTGTPTIYVEQNNNVSFKSRASSPSLGVYWFAVGF